MDTDKAAESTVTSRKRTSTKASGRTTSDTVSARWTTTTSVSTMVTGRTVSATERVSSPIKKPVMFIQAGGASARRRATALMCLRKPAWGLLEPGIPAKWRPDSGSTQTDSTGRETSRPTSPSARAPGTSRTETRSRASLTRRRRSLTQMPMNPLPKKKTKTLQRRKTSSGNQPPTSLKLLTTLTALSSERDEKIMLAWPACCFTKEIRRRYKA